MDNNWIEVSAAVLSSSALTGLITNIFARRKYKAEASQIIANASKTSAEATASTVDAVLRWADMLTVRISALEKSDAEKAVIITDLKVKLVRLEMVLAKAGTPTPEENLK